jgi:hypothetical protein
VHESYVNLRFPITEDVHVNEIADRYRGPPRKSVPWDSHRHRPDPACLDRLKPHVQPVVHRGLDPYFTQLAARLGASAPAVTFTFDRPLVAGALNAQHHRYKLAQDVGSTPR